MLAPQRGLIATVKSKNNDTDAIQSVIGFGKTKTTAGEILPEFSKFDCLPGRAGGTPGFISVGNESDKHNEHIRPRTKSVLLLFATTEL